MNEKARDGADGLADQTVLAGVGGMPNGNVQVTTADVVDDNGLHCHHYGGAVEVLRGSVV